MRPRRPIAGGPLASRPGTRRGSRAAEPGARRWSPDRDASGPRLGALGAVRREKPGFLAGAPGAPASPAARDGENSRDGIPRDAWARWRDLHSAVTLCSFSCSEEVVLAGWVA